MWSEITQAIVTIFGHFFTLLAGCVATVLVALYEKFFRREPIPRKVYAWMLVGFLFWACILSIRDEHRNSQELIEEKKIISGELGLCNGHFEATVGKAEFFQEQTHMQQQTINNQQATLTAQQQTLNSQQGTMNSCVLALGRKAVGEPLQISLFMQELPSKSPKAMDIILLTNRVTRMRGDLECSKPFSVVQWTILGPMMIKVGGGVMPLAANKVYLSWESPEWEPGMPVLITVSSENGTDGCTFKLRSSEQQPAP